ncbi:MAG: phage holin family protein [Dermatophilaceae bacterium]
MSSATPEADAQQLTSTGTRGGDTPAEEPTIGRLVHDAFTDTSTLVRSEIELAKAEISTDVKKVGKGGGMLAAAGVVALFALTFLLHTVAIAIGVVLPLWAGYLIVTVVLLLVAGVLALIGKKALSAVRGKPERTIASSKETIDVVKAAAQG